MIASSFHFDLSPQQQVAAVAAGLLAVSTVSWLVLRKSSANQEALERGRRDRLSRTGRITDGSLVDTMALEGSGLESAARAGSPPHMLQFRYRIAGVVYETAQDVSALSDQVQGLRIDLPVQVRYDHRNPANSIVVAETWSGVQTKHPSHQTEER